MAVSITSLVVALVALLSSRSQWRRSGPEIVVIARVVHGALMVEVLNSGRLPAVIREAGIARAGHGRYPLVPMDGRRAREPGTLPADVYPVTIPPTGFFMAA